ncbi:hypothetical protein [Kitasatospora sp. NBC_01266]|uniref:hypothetical protein n=1 Tax=Kitasatospora sp. NBC_01266 TaxID=2903572 RepID=UPI002E36BC76|nr:hypothetical protein [Kitasatospora sp. NBC_01266]
MISTTRISLAAAAAAALLVVTAGSSAAAGPRRSMQPHAISSDVLVNGADGTERTLSCPPDENVLSGGFTVSAGAGHTLDTTPADVLASRPTVDATGWIVAVGKRELASGEKAPSVPADLTIQIVCTEGESGPGA